MPRYLKINIICILFLALCIPASSELYQYKDENGIMRLTDNPYSVPAASRSQLEQFSEFEGLSDELAILPIQKESLPQAQEQTQEQAKTQPKTEKVIYPKTSKDVPVTAEAQKEILLPDTVKKITVESKEKSADPFQPVYSEKPIKEPDTKVSPREQHKSNKIVIRKIDKKSPSEKTARIKPEKSIAKKQDTEKPAIIKKPSPKIPKKVVQVPKEADSQKAGIEPTKTVGKKPIQKIKPETQIAKKEPSKKITTQKSEPIPDSKTKKTTPPKIETVAQKTAPDTKMATKEPQKNINKNTRPVTHETVTKKKTHTEIRKEITRITKKTTEIETKTVPQVRKMKTDKPVSSQAEKDLDSLITANKKDLKKLTETKKIETDNSKVTQKDESIVLAKLESTRKVLANKKKALNEKFMALMKEKQEIENSVNEDDEKCVLEYNENVKNLNIRIKQYKKEKKFLQAEIEKYNDTIKQSALN